jgi:hypothetical protein
VVVATFLELVVVFELFRLPKTEERTVAKAAVMTVPVEIAELGSGLAEDPLVVAARSFDGNCLALRRQWTSRFSLAELLLHSFWFLCRYQCYDLFCDIYSKSMDLLDHGFGFSELLFPFLFLLTKNPLLCLACCLG